jgi:membrane fusion protein, heavy metal efflux system
MIIWRSKPIMKASKNMYLVVFFEIYAFLNIILSPQYASAVGEEELGVDTARSTVVSENVGLELSDLAQKSIGLKVVEANIKPVEGVLPFNGIVIADPNRVSEVSTRAEGRIKELYADLGSRVEKGQKLVALFPRTSGNPPLIAITAPQSGIIIERNVSLGGSVAPNETLFRIADLSNVIIEGDVFESDVSKVKLGQDARVRLDAYPDIVFKGKVSFIANQVDPEKYTLHIWISIDNKLGLLKPELFAKVNVAVRPANEVLAVPIQAIIDDGAEKFVFVKKGDHFFRQEVATGISDDRYVEITDGLNPGDQVVTDGNRKLYTKWLFSR